MPPKGKDGGKKGGKKLQVLAQLNAAQATYKAACRRHGVPLDKALATELEEAIQSSGTIEKVSLTGPDVQTGSLRAALELMCGYPGVRNLGCWGCSVGSDGVSAIASLLSASANKRWQGSKLRLLEVVADGAGTPLEAWPATCMAHMSGKLAVQGAGHEQPSWLLGTTAPRVTDLTLRLQEWGMAQPSHQQLQQELTNAARVGAPLTALSYRALEDVKRREDQAAAAAAASGRMTCLPASAAAVDSSRLPLQPGAPTTASQLHGSLQQHQPGGGQHLSWAVREDASQEAGKAAAAAAAPSGRTHAPYGSGSRQGGPEHPVTGCPGARSAERRPDEFRARQPACSVSDAPGYLAGYDGAVGALQARPMAFGVPALQALGRALGTVGVGLQILVLDHNQLGDLGMHALAPGLARCSSLKQLSLSGCGLGAVAAHALAVALTPPHAAASQPPPPPPPPPPPQQQLAPHAEEVTVVAAVVTPSDGDGEQPEAPPAPPPAAAAEPAAAPAAAATTTPRTLTPQLLHLNLSRNPLGGRGVHSLCAGLAHCTTLKVLNLNSVGLTEDDVPALDALAAALEAAAPSLDQVDLDANFFGDAGARALVPLLQRTKHMRKLRVTAHGMSRQALGGCLLVTSLVRENLPAKKKAGGRKAAAAAKK